VNVTTASQFPFLLRTNVQLISVHKAKYRLLAVKWNAENKYSERFACLEEILSFRLLLLSSYNLYVLGKIRYSLTLLSGHMCTWLRALRRWRYNVRTASVF
jgi:hypothetical protein